MGGKRWVVPKLAVAASAVLSIAVPTAIAQGPPSVMQGGVVVLPPVVTTDVHGNIMVTEQTMFDGMLLKKEVTVTTPTGQFISRVETILNAPGQGAKEQPAAAEGTITKIQQEFQNGWLIKEDLTVTTSQGIPISKVETTFNLATGRVVQRETETVVGGTVTKIEEKCQTGRLETLTKDVWE